MAPGLIDTHVHVESSLVLPDAFEEGVLPRGTTTAICDPHEIANVLGIAGIRYFLEAATRLVMTLKVNLSSCVPATDLETAGARLEVDDLLPLADHPAALGLAEMMNFPGVLAADPGLLAKLEAFAGRHLDGHAPLLGGRALNAYLAAGIRTDHECTRLEEAAEKLRKGMIVLMREGSVAKNVTALAPLITEHHLATARLLHRRPQPAGDDRGRPSRRWPAQGDPGRRAAGGGLSRCHAGCRPGLRPARSRRAGAGLPRRPRAARRPGGSGGHHHHLRRTGDRARHLRRADDARPGRLRLGPAGTGRRPTTSRSRPRPAPGR